MRNFLSIVLIFSFLHSGAQNKKHATNAKRLTEFKFKELIGGVILVKAKLNDLPGDLNFILDTGSGAISLDSATVVNNNIPHQPSGRKVSGIAGVREVDFSPNNTLTMPGLKIDSLDFYINDYQILTGVYGIKIDGIIGYSFFKRFIVKVDFDSSKLSIFTPGNIRYPKQGTLLHPAFSALPIQRMLIRDKAEVNSNFYLDTGAGLCLLVSKQFVSDSSFLAPKRKPFAIQVQGLGGKKRLSLTVIKKVKIGPYQFRKVPTTILDDEFNALSYPHIIGLIGNDLLRRFNLVINYPDKEIHLSANSHFRDDFDYSYTGVNLYFDEGLIIADDVIENSPAFFGGLKKDDIIVAINNNFSQNIILYNTSMSEVGKRIEMIIRRDSELITIHFIVGKIN
ncbi:MAG: aspartyl protease family protein [Ginsengibacter sp.]